MSGEYWRGYRGGPARTATIDSESSVSQLTEQWSVGLRDATVLGEALRTTPYGLLVGRSDGLSVLDTDSGSQRWNYTQAAPTHGVEYAEGRVYLGTDTGVVAIDAQSGAEVDTFPIDIAPTADRPDSLAVTETTLIVNTTDGLAAYDTTDGSLLWQAGGRPAHEFVVGDDHAYTRVHERIHAVVLDSGRQRWEITRDDTEAHYDALRGARPEGVLVKGNPGGTLGHSYFVTLLRKDDGGILVDNKISALSQCHLVGNVALVASNGDVTCQRLADGSVEWEQSLTGINDTPEYDDPRASAGDTFYLTTGRQITALNIETGAETARVQLTHPIDAIAPVGDQLFVAGDTSVTAYEDQVTKVFDG